MESVAQIPLLRTAYASMTRKERRIADYIAMHEDSIMNETVADLAHHTNSSEITVSRFCKKLGFSGLQGLKIALARDMATAEGEVYHNIRPDDTTDVVAARVFQNTMDGLQDTLKILNFSAVDKAATLLLQAKNILVYGFGNSATVCKDIETRFLRFGFAIRAYADAHMQATTAALLTPQDVVLAVSHRGLTKELIESVQTAKNSNAQVIAITSYIGSPLARLADVVLTGMGRETKLYSEAIASRLVHMAISDILYMRIAMQMQDQYEENMKKMRAVIAQKRG